MAKQTQLRPAVINAKMVFRIGIILWALALLGLGAFHYAGYVIPPRYPFVAMAGIALGLVGYWWAHRNHLISDDGLSEVPPAEG